MQNYKLKQTSEQVQKAIDDAGTIPELWGKVNGLTERRTPQMYGAKGDGETDDTAAFKAALAAERVVFVPGGTYKLSSGIDIGGNCMLELSQDTVLVFTNTTGYCINLDMSSTLKGNHATINVPYWFEGSVLYAYSCDRTEIEQRQIPPWTKWDPQWKTARYITDINICKDDDSQGDDRGFHYAVNPTDCRGAAVYIEADKTTGMSTYMWGNHFSGIRIAGAFSYGIRAVNKDGGWLNDMRIEAAYIDACEIGVSLEECGNVYVSASIQPRRAYTLDKAYKPYAKHGVQLIRSKNVDLSTTRVWDWNTTHTLWTDGGEYQHISMIGECRGAILGDFIYYENSIDIRKLIHTDTKSNLSQLVIIQEPIDRWFRMREGIPYCTDGTMEYRILTDDALDPYFKTEAVKYFTDVLESATDIDGVTVFNDIGYKEGVRFTSLGTGTDLTPSLYYMTTGFIPVQPGSVLDCNALSYADVAKTYAGIVYYDSNRQRVANMGIANVVNGTAKDYVTNYAETKKGCTFKIASSVTLGNLGVAYIRLVFPMTGVGANPMIAVDEVIEYTIEGFLADGVKVKGENIIGITGQVTPDWIATKTESGGDAIVITEQTLTSGMWSGRQMDIEPGVSYDVYINDKRYTCVAFDDDGSICLGNNSDLTLNDYPFCVSWFGGASTSGMFFKDDTLIYPIGFKVMSGTFVVYNKMPEGYLPDKVVKSVNGKSGDVQLSASDVGARPSTWTPSAEDVGADASGTAGSKVSEHNTSETSHNDIRLLIAGLTTRLNAIANSTDTDLDQLAEIVAYIKSNKSLIDSITTSKVNVADIIDNLTTSVSNKPLSAKMGVELKKLIDAIKIPTTLPASDVYDWAKQPQKPTYTASEVGAASKEQFAQVSEAIVDKRTYYISPDGSDNNDGLTASTPKKTVKACVNEGAKRISAKRGVYNEKIALYDIGELEVFPTDNDQTYATTTQERQSIVFEMVDYIAPSSLATYNSIKRVAYSNSANTQFDKVFTKMSLEPVVSIEGSRYNATVWLLSEDEKAVCIKLKPVLTVAECEAEVNTFTCVSGYIYINATMTNVAKIVVPTNWDSGFYIKGVEKLILREVEVRFSGTYNIDIRNCAYFDFDKCTAKYTSYASGFHPVNANGIMTSCYATKNYDGFGVSGYGHTKLIDCISEFNFDDGVSHHEGCEGTVIGGRYEGNGKGGNVPAYGAKVNIYGGLYKDNAAFGIGYLWSSGYNPASGIVQGAVITDNPIGLKVDSNCTVTEMLNCFNGNDTDKVLNGNVTTYEYNYVKTINGESPDKNGNIELDCEVVEPVLFTNVLKLAEASANDTSLYNETGYMNGYRLNSSAIVKEQSDCGHTGFMPASDGAVMRFKNITACTVGYGYIHYFKSDKSTVATACTSITATTFTTDANGVSSFTLPAGKNIAFVRLSYGTFSEDSVITMNEEIVS